MLIPVSAEEDIAGDVARKAARRIRNDRKRKERKERKRERKGLKTCLVNREPNNVCTARARVLKRSEEKHLDRRCTTYRGPRLFSPLPCVCEDPSILVAFPRFILLHLALPFFVRVRNTRNIRASATCPVMNARHKTRMLWFTRRPNAERAVLINYRLLSARPCVSTVESSAFEAFLYRRERWYRSLGRFSPLGIGAQLI